MKPILAGLLSALLLTGCMTTGYHYAKDPNMVKKWDVTVVSVQTENIYNSAGVFWVGPFAAVDSKGWKVTFLDETGTKVSIVQPSTDRYELHPGQKAVYVVDRGHVWVQPQDFPLPPDFADSSKTVHPDSGRQQPVADKAAALKTSQQPAPNAPTRDDSARLEKLKALRDRGIITQEEYDRKKREILDSM